MNADRNGDSDATMRLKHEELVAPLVRAGVLIGTDLRRPLITWPERVPEDKRQADNVAWAQGSLTVA